MQSIKTFIPGTQARRDRLFSEILAKEVDDKDGLAFVEWEDGSTTMKPVVWNSDLSCIMDEDGNMWFARGLGAEPTNFNGIPVWHVFAGNAGIISTEASLIADQERHGDVIDVGEGDTVPNDLIELGIKEELGDPSANGEGDLEPSAAAGNGQQTARADGGHVINEDVDGAIYDLRPPKGYDGVAISIREPDNYDPYPVTRQDAKAAAEWFEQAGSQATDVWMKGFIVGLVVFGLIWTLMTVIPWLLGQVGGAGGGGETINGLLLLLAGPTSIGGLVERFLG